MERGKIILACIIFFSAAVCRTGCLVSRSKLSNEAESFAQKVGSLSNALPHDTGAVHVLTNHTMPVGKRAGRHEPRVYFLFLAVDKISNVDVWTSYFHTAVNADAYRAYVHCKTASCKTQIEGSPIRPVPTVENSYCTDLVSPMNALVDHALRQDLGDSHPADKFVFLSDSTLPAKPFSFVMSKLTAHTRSDFCMFPVSEWAELESLDGPMVLPKSLQWITLSRTHAEESVRLWADRLRPDSVTRRRMDQLELARRTKNYGCLDEFWYVLALNGPLQSNGGAIRPVNTSNISGVSLDLASTGEGRGWQGVCDTFVLWSSFLKAGHHNPFERLFSDLDTGSVPHWGSVTRPGWWDSLTEAGMKAFRRSDFLFVRKFIDHPELKNSSFIFPQAYARNIFL